MKNIWIILAIAITISCSKTQKKVEHDSFKGNELKQIEKIVLKKHRNDKILLVYFDGTCSNCVMTFIEFLKNCKLKDNSICYFISKSDDTYQTEFVMTKLGLKLKPNQLLMADKGELIFKNNNWLNDSMSVLLLNNNQRVITSLNPLNSEQAKENYKDSGLIE